MAKVSCNIFDKNKNFISDSSIIIRKIDYIHALLLLNGVLKFSEKFNLFLSYLYRLNCDLTFSKGEIKLSRGFDKAYDGIKRELSEIYGAANTIIVALKQFKQKYIFPLETASKEKRPDFVALDSSHNQSLFESKGSINQVQARDIKKSIDQLNSKMSSKKPSPYIRGYSVISDFNLDSNKSLSIRIYNPEPNSFEKDIFDLMSNINSYHESICKIISNSPEGSIRYFLDKKEIIGTLISLDAKESVFIGIEKSICNKKYDSYVLQPLKEIRNLGKNLFHDDIPEEEMFDDGLYLKIIKGDR